MIVRIGTVYPGEKPNYGRFEKLNLTDDPKSANILMSKVREKVKEIKKEDVGEVVVVPESHIGKGVGKSITNGLI